MNVLLPITVMLPLPFAVAALAAGGVPRIRKALCATYSLASVGLNVALLNRFLVEGGGAWGSLKLDRLGLSVFLVLNLVSAAAVFYAGFRRASGEGFTEGLLLASLLATCGLAAAASLERGLLAFALLWESVTAAALVGLLAAGRGVTRRRMLAFLPWLVSDALFLAGAALTAVWLEESTVLIKPPLTAGSEAQTVVVMVLFLLSALIRLGVFPFNYWIAELIDRADPSWNAMVLGAVNFLLAGLRLVVVAALIARLVASDWSIALALLGGLSVVAGPVCAARAKTFGQYAAGMYALQAGFILAGTALFSRAGVGSALLCLLAPPAALAATFMALGTVAGLKGGALLNRETLSRKSAKAAYAAMLLSGLSLAGLPPMDGFVSKALTVLSGFERAVVEPLYGLLAVAGLAGTAIALLALAHMLSRTFGDPGGPLPLKRPGALEGVAPLAACGASLLLGLFPGLLLENFVEGGSRQLFRTGFAGPGVVFRGSGRLMKQAVTFYTGWSETAAAFLFTVAALALILYFVNSTRREGSAWSYPAGEQIGESVHED